MSILVIESDYLSRTVFHSQIGGRSYEISAHVLPRREEMGLHVQKRVRRRDGRNHDLCRGTEEERSASCGRATRPHKDGHKRKSPEREVVRDRRSLCLSLIHISEPTRLLSISYAV